MSKIANIFNKKVKNQARQKAKALKQQDKRPLLNPKDAPEGTYDFVVTGLRVKKENGQGVVTLLCNSTDPHYQPTTLTLPYPFTLQFEAPSRILKPQAGAVPPGGRLRPIH